MWLAVITPLALLAGTELETWITKPTGFQGGARTILTLTQYDIDGGCHADAPGAYARRGYVFVHAYVRAQPWSHGRVGMFGGSYVGMTHRRSHASPAELLGRCPPDVSTIRLGKNVRRARFRNSQFDQELVKPGQLRLPLAAAHTTD